MATYVLVHGGGHGGWCYQPVARLLRAKGHDVYTPTLTGTPTFTPTPTRKHTPQGTQPIPPSMKNSSAHGSCCHNRCRSSQR
mgnify:CR=1 FL=1